MESRARGRWLNLVLAGTLAGMFAAGIAWAIEPFAGFDAPSSRGVKLPADFNGFHFENKSDSSLGWMNLIHLKDGGWLTVLFTVANLGPYHMSSSFGGMYMHPDGRVYTCNGMWNDSDFMTPAPADRYHVRIHNSSFGGKYPDFYIKMDEEGCKADIKFKSLVPSFTQGSGVARFGEKQPGKWQLFLISPRATTSGYIQFKQAKIDLAGDGYLEEVATDMLVPTISDRWYILRTVNGPYTINLFDIQVDRKNYGNGHVRTLMVARDDKIIMGTTRFTYTPGPTWKDPTSGVSVPMSFQLAARDGDTVLSGTVRTGKILNSMDLLNKLPTMARLFAGAMYGKPFQYRSAAEYDLVLREGGKEIPLKGNGFSEIHFYDR